MKILTKTKTKEVIDFPSGSFMDWPIKCLVKRWKFFGLTVFKKTIVLE